jgi:hypothetical protein
MSRSYAQIKVSIWDDSGDFIDLGPYAKLLYLHLISRRDLSLAGHLVVRHQRWADACFGGRADTSVTALNDLRSRGYVIVDQRTGELLVRTFIRHDNGWRNSKIRKAIEGAIERIESAELSTVARVQLAHSTKLSTAHEGGEPSETNDQQDRASDTRSDGTSDGVPDGVPDSTCIQQPASSNLQPLSSSHVNSTATQPVDKSDDDDTEDQRVTEALAHYARHMSIGKTNRTAYEHTVLANGTRDGHIAHLTHIAHLHPTATPRALADIHIRGLPDPPPTTPDPNCTQCHGEGIHPNTDTPPRWQPCTCHHTDAGPSNSPANGQQVPTPHPNPRNEQSAP